MDQPVRYMLTTVDNPYNPFTDFMAWYGFDLNHGYHTPSLLARIANVPEELSEADQSLELQLAIDEIVRENVNGLYRKVKATDVFPLQEPDN